MAWIKMQPCRSLLAAALLMFGTVFKRIFSTFSLAMIVSLLAIAVGFSPLSAHAASPRLFGTIGNTTTGGTSTLVELNATDGSLVQTIGDVGYVVNGLDYDPVSGKLYATTAASDANFPNGLLTINMLTGAGSPVGSGNMSFTSVNNVRADSAGNLFAWDGSQRLLSIDPATGNISAVGNTGVAISSYGASFNSTGTFYLVNFGTTTIYTVNTATGLATSTGLTVGAMAHHGDFNPATDHYWGIDTTGSGAKNIRVMDVATGSVLQTLPTVNNLHTLAFVTDPCAITVTNANDSGAGSLRQAIADICTGGTIDFAAGLANQTIALTSAELAINKTITIANSSAPNLAISGNNARRLFNIQGSGNVTVSGLRIVNGYVDYSTMGAGAYIASGGKLTLTNCTLSGHSIITYGGVVYNESGGTLTLTNSTVTGNSAGYGSFVFNWGTTTIKNSTIAGNTDSYEGCILNRGTLNMHNTIMGNNSGGDCVHTSASMGANGNNLMESTGSSACDLTDGVNGNIIGKDPLLGTPGSYGGITYTLPLLPGSPAIDAGNDATCAAAPVSGLDQRGITRPQGSHCDIGAFESQGFSLGNLTGTPQSATINAAFATPLGLTVTANNANEPVNGGVVTFTAPGSGASTNPATNTATISGGAVSRSVTANGTVGGPYTVAVSASGAANVAFTLTNLPQGDLQVTKTNNTSSTGYLGVTFNWMVTVGNAGPGTATFMAGQTILSDPLPLQATYGTPTAGSFTNVVNAGNISCAIAANTLTCTASGGSVTLESGASFTVTYSATPTSVGTLTNVATVDPSNNISEPNESNNSGSNTVTVTAPDLGITVSDGGIRIAPGGTIPYTMSYQNTGNAAATGIVITETVPTNTAFSAGASTAGWSCSPNSFAGSTCTFTIGTVSAGAGGSATFAVTVADPLPGGVSQIANTATSADDGTHGTDQNAANNSGSDTTPICPSAVIVANNADSGAGSLRQAIADVCAGGTIGFDSALSGQTITLTGVQLSIGKDLIINGLTTSPGVSVSGNDAKRVFYVSAGTVTINNLTIQNGRNVPAMPGNIGGSGLFVDTGANVTLNNCAVLNNATNGTTTGGGIVVNTGAALTMNNCTVSGNSATFDAGGILNLGTLAVNNSTIVNNSAPGAGGGLETTTNTVTMRNTILAGNSGPSGPDCYTPMQPIQSAGYNLIGSITNCTVTAGTGDVTGLSYPSLLLGPLQNNGGPTSTYALLVGSPAIDAIPGCNGAPAADQRGITRPKGAACDVGAYEAIPMLQTTIDSQPANPVSSASAAFTFSGSGGTGTLGFECQLDGGGFSTCTSPKSYAGLSDGSHTFLVRATDSIGTVDATPASYTWTIDTTAPVITFTSTPTVLANQSDFTFGFSASETVTGYNCTLLRGATVLIGPVSCTSPVPGSVAGTGTYTFLVSATDSAGNSGSNSFTWTVDLTAPDTTIQPTGLPTNPTNLMDAGFTYTGSDVGSGVAGFQCALDGAAFAPCASPKNYTGLANGSHTFQVRAVDNAGNPDPTPASYTWVVDATAPSVTTFTVSSPTNTLSIPITTFTASDTGSGVVSYMITTSATPPVAGDAGWSGTAPTTYSVASAGTYTLYPWAKDAVGNVSAVFASPATATIATVVYAAPGGLTSGFCGTWTNACELSYALNNAVAGQEIWTSAGIYKPTSGSDRTLSFAMKSGVALYGGFAGNETLRSQRNTGANVTILSGDIGTVGDSSDNSYHVVYAANVDSSAILDGFTISGGNANGVNPEDSGSGMYIVTSSPTINNCTFSGNTASNGGGMYVEFASPAISNCTFSGNTASYGGGMYNPSGHPTISNCTFSGNMASYGGGMATALGHPTISNCTLSGNTATYGGGLFSGVFPMIVRNTILVNGGSGGNCNGAISASTSIADDATCSGATQTTAAAINLAPLGNYSGPTQTMALLPGSSAINAGNAVTCTASDQRGMSRVGTCDMGAFESQGFTLGSLTGTPQSATVNTAFATPLGLTVTATNPVEPVAGGTVAFDVTPAASGARIAEATPFAMTIGADGTVAATVTANGTIGGPYTVTAAARGAVDATFSLSNVIHPTVAIAFNPVTINLNGAASLSFTVTNPAATASLTGVAFIDNLPHGLVVATPNGLSGTCGSGTITATAGSGVISLANGTIAAGGSCTFSVNVTGTTGGSFNNTTGAISSTEGGIGATSNTATLTVVPPPAITAITPRWSLLAGGDSVTIQGNNFNGATAVRFGGVPATTVLVLSDTTIVAGVPASSSYGTVDITVTTPLATSAVAPADQFTYVPTVVYAAAGGLTTGACENWTNACELSYAVANAVAGQEIRVAQGVYKPVVPTDPNNVTDAERRVHFAMKSGVKLSGGYAGPGAVSPDTVDTRDIARFPSILSGDIDNNDSQTPVITDVNTVTGTAGNSYNVIYAGGVDATAILDGFTVTGGNGNYPNTSYVYAYGGGLFSRGAPVISNCTFIGNSAVNGGAITVYLGNTAIANTSLAGNTASYAGGLYVLASAPTITNTTFTGNTAVYAGGMYVSDSTPTITSATFTGNRSAGGAGGAVIIQSSNSNASKVTISGTTFVDNISDDGNGLGTGGALQISNGIATLTNSTFNGNRAEGYNDDGGGAIMVYGGTMSVTNCTLSGNGTASTTGGGGISTNQGAVPLNVTLTNTIVAGNASAAAMPDLKGTFTTGGYNFIGAGDGSTGLTDGVASDRVGTNAAPLLPLLGVLGNYGGPTRTMPLLPGSPVIDAGDPAVCANATVNNLDQRGKPRQTGKCAIGAFEPQGFTLTKSAGDNQSAIINAGFATPLAVILSETGGSPLPGATVTFAAPAGASATLSSPATTGADGSSGVTATANGSAGSYSITASVAGGTSVDFSLTNLKGSQAITFGTAPAIIFGGTGTVSATGGLSGNAVTFTSTTPAVCSVSGTTVTGLAAGDCIIAADQVGNGNYNAASQVTQTIAIAKVNQTITFGTAPAVIYGGTGTISATATSGLAVTFTSATPTVCSVSGTIVTALAAGDCTIAADQTGNTNYNAASRVTQSFAVAKGGQTITFGTAPTVYVHTTGTLSATASSGLAVSFTSTTPSICTVSGSTVTGVAPGTCIIAADQSGDANYTAASQVTQDIPVAVAISLTVSALADGAVTTETTQNVSGTVTNPTYLGTLTINGVAVTVTPAGSFSYPVQLIAGANIITVIATGTTGDVLTDSRTITLEALAPHVTISSPADNTSIKQQFITVSGTVNRAATTVTCSVNGGTAQAADISGGDFTCTPNLAAGINTILVTAADTTGTTAQAKRTVNSFPGFSLAIANPAGDMRTVRSGYTLTGTVADNTTPVTVTITMDGQTYSPAVTDGSFSQALTFTEGKVYQVTVTGADQNGTTVTVQRNIIYSTPTTSPFTIEDALKALQMAVGVIPPQPDLVQRLDVAPMVNGVSVGDGIIDVEDAIVILRMVVGQI